MGETISKMGDTINIKEYIDIFRKRKKIVFIILFVFLLAGGFLQYRNYKSYVPTYTSTVSVRININKNTKSKDSDNENSQVYSGLSLESSALNQSISEKYSSLAVSKRSMMELIDKLDLQASTEMISQNISVAPEENLMEFIDITVSNQDPDLAQKIASTMPEVFNNELKRVIGLDCVEVLYDATEPLVSPKPKDNTFRNFALIGIALAIFIVLLLECLDNKVVTPDDAEKYWGIPVIGIVPLDKKNSRGKRVSNKEVKA